MVNLLEKLNYTRTTLIQGKDAEGREEGKKLSFINLRPLFVVDEQFPHMPSADLSTVLRKLNMSEAI